MQITLLIHPQKNKSWGAVNEPPLHGFDFLSRTIEILNTFTRLETVKPELANELNSLIGGRKPTKIVQEIEKYILRQLEINPIRTEIEQEYERIIPTNGYNISVKQLAKDMGYTTRHISDLFKKHLGLSLKKFLQIIRFNQGRSIMERKEWKSIKDYS